ncbi:MAG: SDR family oxidoreductase [Thermoplasmata archaeon]
MRWLILGGSGQIGEALAERLVARGDTVVGTYRNRPPRGRGVEPLRWEKGGSTELPWERLRPDGVIDAASLRFVDDCERHPDEAERINHQGTIRTARGARTVGARYLLISTDYVFGAPTPAPHPESEPPQPRCAYARTLRAAEAALLAEDDRATVVRTSTVYSWRPSDLVVVPGLPASPNFATWLVGEIRAGRTARIVVDQVSAPTYVPDLAEALEAILDRPSGTGIFHATGSTALSRYAWALRLLESIGEATDRVVPVPTASLGQAAPRPSNSTLGLSRLTREIGRSMPDLDSQLRRWSRAVRAPT